MRPSPDFGKRDEMSRYRANFIHSRTETRNHQNSQTQESLTNIRRYIRNTLGGFGLQTQTLAVALTELAFVTEVTGYVPVIFQLFDCCSTN